MRHRFTTLCAALSAAALLAVPGLAGAAPRHNHGLTIAVTENPIEAGQSLAIYGQLKGPDAVGRTIVLYHHINGTHTGYSAVQRTTTGAGGFYLLNRADGVVMTNRQWFVRLAGDPAVHSRTIHEDVHALVSIDQTAVNGTTAQPVTFTGSVTPNHTGNRVALQRQLANGDWQTLTVRRIGPGSRYSITYRWRTPDTHVVRVALPRDLRNLGGHSGSVQVTIQQAQNPRFTINAANPTIPFGSSDTITGTQFAKGSMSAPQPSTPIELCHGPVRGHVASCDQNTTTGTDGSYSFSVTPNTNQWYFVKTVLAPRRRTANLFIGVRDLITASVTGPHQVGQPDAFSGTVTGGTNKAGELVLLERKGADGEYHDVALGRVKPDGTYSITWRYGTSGSKVLRTRVLGDGLNLGAASDPVEVNVTQPPVSTLAPAS